METIKISSNVEFDVIYADGTRKRVPEGILFGVEDERIIFHNGTMRPAVIVAVAEAAAEVIGNMHFPEPELRNIAMNMFRNLHAEGIAGSGMSGPMRASTPTKETNGDQIRRIGSMTDPELAELLWKFLGARIDEILRFCANDPECDEFAYEGVVPEENCKACLIRWLGEEAKKQEIAAPPVAARNDKEDG